MAEGGRVEEEEEVDEGMDEAEEKMIGEGEGEEREESSANLKLEVGGGGRRQSRTTR